MIDFSFETLRQLGLSTHMAQVLTAAQVPVESGINPASAAFWVRASAVHRETVEVHDGRHTHSARPSLRLTRELLAQGSSLAVGDWLLCQTDAHQQWWLLWRAAPMNQIVRRDADGSRHTVVSNIDTALLVMGLDLDFNLRRLERYLVLVASSAVLPVVVLSKADILAAAQVELRISEVRARVGQQVDVVAVDGRSAQVSEVLRPYLGLGQTLVLLGSSGAGKSTLTNNLLGTATQDTGVVRAHDSRGKHTTTARSLHLLPTGACVIDTPGVRTLRPDVDATTLSSLFDDISTLAQSCRFRDCSHQDEPGCAVSGQVSPERLKNYHKMLRESRRDSMSALERQQQLSQWKVKTQAGRQRSKMKREGG